MLAWEVREEYILKIEPNKKYIKPERVEAGDVVYVNPQNVEDNKFRYGSCDEMIETIEDKNYKGRVSEIWGERVLVRFSKYEREYTFTLDELLVEDKGWW